MVSRVRRSMRHVEERVIDTAGEPDPAPPYTELARRLLAEHAELFRVSPLAISPPRAEWQAAGARPAGARRRTPQLTLPLRPRVLDGGKRGRTP